MPFSSTRLSSPMSGTFAPFGQIEEALLFLDRVYRDLARGTLVEGINETHPTAGIDPNIVGTVEIFVIVVI